MLLMKKYVHLHFPFAYLFTLSFSNLTKFRIFTFSNCLAYHLVKVNAISLFHIFCKFSGPDRFYFRHIHFLYYLFTPSCSNPTKFGFAFADLPERSSSSMQLNSHMSQPFVLFNSHVFLSLFLTQPNGGLANILSVL